MKTITGTIEKNDLEGGIWTLIAEDGETFMLDGGDAALFRDGLKVRITGDETHDVMGIGMVGSFFKVKEYKIL